MTIQELVIKTVKSWIQNDNSIQTIIHININDGTTERKNTLHARTHVSVLHSMQAMTIYQYINDWSISWCLTFFINW